MTDQLEKIKLFDDDEEVEDNDDFKIRPQYEGPHGQELLELNTQLSERFKLDERFAEDSQLEDGESKKGDDNEEEDEKKRNIKILESVLGHEISTKVADKSFSKRKQVRFDPDDENASKLIKVQETADEKPKKSKKRKVVNEDKVEPEIPVSKERYIEVCPDLKEILNTATQFSFSKKFNLDPEELSTTTPFSFSQKFNADSEEVSQNEVSRTAPKEKDIQQFGKKARSEINMKNNMSTEYFNQKTKWESFFVCKGDTRLKDGVDFFKLPDSLDRIRDDWQKRRDNVLEMFKRRQKSGQRSYSKGAQRMQMKNSIRKNNFKT